ncbi:BTB/POZ protein [Rhizophagus irregularis DAOM 181602=DAOM 197198]|nr:BTB/POZ protein [Rhizophagus irregularis DAOM 181602=DAOM 197198]
MFNKANTFQNLNNCADDCDVNIQIGEGSNSEIFKAHSNILRIRSTYFNTALSSYWAKKEGNIFIFKKPNIKPDIFRIILNFIYTGTISLLDINRDKDDKLNELLIAADEIGLNNELIDYIQIHINELSKENIILLFNTLKMIPYDSLISLIKNDYFQMKEIDIWNNLIKWAIAKNPTISSHTSNWKSKEIEIIKNTIQKFIPYIRFFQISPDDYYEKVHPLSALLPNKLKKEINLHFIDSRIPISTKILRPRIFIKKQRWNYY